MNCLTKLFQQKRRRIGYILAFSGPMISKRDSSESKDDGLDENIVKQFCNDLIDQQLREITTEKYGHIRDLIVEEAFKPVSQ